MLQTKLKIINELPSNFQKSVLPTNGDVIKAIYFKKYKANIPFDSAKETISQCVANIWNCTIFWHHNDCLTIISEHIWQRSQCTHKQWNDVLKWCLRQARRCAVKSNEMVGSQILSLQGTSCHSSTPSPILNFQVHLRKT